MVNLSKLLMGESASFPGDGLRFGEKTPARSSCPVLVWHVTDSCNLRCRHCYSLSGGDGSPKEMRPGEAFQFLDMLAILKPPALLMSGGEPLRHPDFFEYLSRARSNGLRVSLSTNGTLIDRSAAEKIAGAGVIYAGISLDGTGAANDAFRGRSGAFEEALRGINALVSRGCRVGLRATLAQPLLRDLDALLDLALSLPISRICFYHFMPSGRGALDEALAPDENQERRALSRIIEWADEVCSGGASMEILTVGDASDGVLVYKYLRRRDLGRASVARSLLERSAARRNAHGILSVRWDGAVFPNQFSWDAPLGDWRGLERIIAGPGEDHSGCEGCGWGKMCAGSVRKCAMPEAERCGGF
jgi:MoaA/NifB/PqqE/SkfB family radical SAM enzyme